MKDLKNMIMESSRNITSKKNIEVELECRRTKLVNVWSATNVDYYDDEDDEETYYKNLGYSSPDDAFVNEEGSFSFESKFELTLKVDGKKETSFEISVEAAFDSSNNDYWLNEKDTHVMIGGKTILFGFTPSEVAKAVYDAIDKDSDLWDELKKEFGYKKNEDPHELVYGKAFEEDLCEYIADAYEGHVDWVKSR